MFQRKIICNEGVARSEAVLRGIPDATHFTSATAEISLRATHELCPKEVKCLGFQTWRTAHLNLRRSRKLHISTNVEILHTAKPYFTSATAETSLRATAEISLRATHELCPKEVKCLGFQTWRTAHLNLRRSRKLHISTNVEILHTAKPYFTSATAETSLSNALALLPLLSVSPVGHPTAELQIKKSLYKEKTKQCLKEPKKVSPLQNC